MGQLILAGVNFAAVVLCSIVMICDIIMDKGISRARLPWMIFVMVVIIANSIMFCVGLSEGIVGMMG